IPAAVGACYARALGDLRKRTVAVVVIEAVLAVIGDEDIVIAVIVNVGNTGTLAPAGVSEAGFARDIGERAVAVIAVEMADRFRRTRGLRELRTTYQEYVGEAIAIVIDKCHATAVHFKNIFLVDHAARDVGIGQSGLRAGIGELHWPFLSNDGGADESRQENQWQQSRGVSHDVSVPRV